MPRYRQEEQSLIMVLNCGSSSLKYEVYEMPSRRSLGKGGVERVGQEDAFISQESVSGRYERQTAVENH